MSTRHDSQTVKSAASGEELTRSEITDAHQRSFGNLMDVVEKEAGLEGDQIPYWDPMGHLNGRGEAIDLKSTLFEKYKGAFKKFNEMQREGHSIQKATEEVAKATGTSSFQLPIYFTPEVHRTDRRDTPLADMLARTAVREAEVKVDELTDVGAAGSFSEPSGAGENWPEADDTYNKMSYPVVSYGRRNKVTDRVQLSASTLRSTQAITEENQVASIRHYEENQIVKGSTAHDFDGDGTNDVAANDTNGFDGLLDHAETSGKVVSAGTDGLQLSEVRSNIEYLRRKGASRESIVHATDHATFKELQGNLTDFTRYESPDDTLSFGYQALDIDGTPVVESHGCPYTDDSDSRVFVSFDASAHYMSMLQDVTMHPLARTSPQEEFATDAYGTLVSEAPSRTAAVWGI